MNEDTHKIIEEQMTKLPADVKEAIISIDYESRLREITKRQKLLIDQAGKLEMETTLVMIGLEPISDYISNLESHLELSTERAQEIASDVNENIFKPIRQSLEKMDEQMLKGENNESTTEEKKTGSTTQEKEDLDRNQILKEIEDPSIIDNGNRTIEIRPPQALKTIPEQANNDTKTDKMPPKLSILQSKMTQPTIISQEIIEKEENNKLPEIDKSKPASVIDPYREPIV